MTEATNNTYFGVFGNGPFYCFPLLGTSLPDFVPCFAVLLRDNLQLKCEC